MARDPSEFVLYGTMMKTRATSITRIADVHQVRLDARVSRVVVIRDLLWSLLAKLFFLGGFRFFFFSLAWMGVFFFLWMRG